MHADPVVMSPTPSPYVPVLLYAPCRLSEKSIRVTRPSLFSTLAADPTSFSTLSQQLLELVASGVVVPAVHQVYPLSQAAQAQADLTGRGTTGKLLLRPDHLMP
jgi:NADPH2:quinone reductase